MTELMVFMVLEKPIIVKVARGMELVITNPLVIEVVMEVLLAMVGTLSVSTVGGTTMLAIASLPSV